jgi:hypothetical protein
MTVDDAFDEFLLRQRLYYEDGTPDIGAVLTKEVLEDNTLKAKIWGAKHLPGGYSSANNPDWWVLAFSNCVSLGVLKVDPNYLTKAERTQRFIEFDATVSPAVLKMIYQNDEAFVQQLTAEQREVLASLGGPRAVKHLVDSGVVR